MRIDPLKTRIACLKLTCQKLPGTSAKTRTVMLEAWARNMPINEPRSVVSPPSHSSGCTEKLTSYGLQCVYRLCEGSIDFTMNSQR